MRIRVLFGLTDNKEMSWFRPLEDFPKLIKYLGKNYEWLLYEEDPTGQVDQILTFSQLPGYDPNYGVWCPNWTDMTGWDPDKCECGAKYGSFDWDHFRYCKKWSPW